MQGTARRIRPRPKQSGCSSRHARWRAARLSRSRRFHGGWQRAIAQPAGSLALGSLWRYRLPSSPAFLDVGVIGLGVCAVIPIPRGWIWRGRCAAALDVDRRRRRHYDKRRVVGRRGVKPEGWRTHDDAEAYTRSAEVMAADVRTADIAASRVSLITKATTARECRGARYGDQ